MPFRQAIISALHLFIVLITIVLSGFFFFLAADPNGRIALIRLLQEEPGKCVSCGVITALLGLFLTFAFFRMGRARYLRIFARPHLTVIEPKLLEHVIFECFHRRFPENVRSIGVVVADEQRLEISVRLTMMEAITMLRMMRLMQNELQVLLAKRFGYIRPFTLSVESIT